MNTTTSSAPIMPRSPCSASAGCTKNDGVPVLASDAAIFLPIWPDLPMPEITALPRQLSSSSQAQTKLSSRRASRRCASVSSISSVSRAKASRALALLIRVSYQKDIDAFRLQGGEVIGVDVSVGDQRVDGAEFAHHVRALAAEFRGVYQQNNAAGGFAHRFADVVHFVEGGDAGVEIDAVRADKQLVEAELLKRRFGQAAVERGRFLR